jgi:hypothetical protein
VLRLHIDTFEYTFKIGSGELREKLIELYGCRGREVELGGVRCLVRRVGGLWPVEVRTESGVRVQLPEEGFESRRVRVIAGADYCAGLACGSMHSAVVKLLGSVLGLDMSDRDLVMSRVDPALDVRTSLVEADALFAMVDDGEVVVTRGRSQQDFSSYKRCRRRTGFAIGRGDVRLRVYDKREECTKPGKRGKWEVWLERWGLASLPDDETVVRSEWQLKRDFLKQFGAHTLDDFLARAADVLGYTNGSWFRLAGPPAGKLHKRETLPVWSSVAAAFVSGEWSRGIGAKRVKVLPVLDVDALLAQAAGCLRGVAAAVGLRDGNGEVVSSGRAMVALRDHIERLPERWVEGVARSMLAQQYGAAA